MGSSQRLTQGWLEELVSETALVFLSNLFLWRYLEVLLVGFSCQHFCLGKQLLGSAVPLLTQMYLFNILNFPKISGKMATILLALVRYFYCFQNTSTFIGSYVFFHTSNSSFNPIQSGFLPHHSTKAALIQVSNNFHFVKSHGHFSGFVLLNKHLRNIRCKLS